MCLDISEAYDRQNEVRELFQEYTDSLLSSDENIAVILRAQNYQKEFNDLASKYGLPDGRLYLAYWKQEPAGCIALRRLDEECCEMKRLYVRPKFRGKNIGGSLAQRVIEDAKAIGYKHMRLDTMAFMENAVRMYQKLGFYEIDKYYDNPVEGTIYLQLDL